MLDAKFFLDVGPEVVRKYREHITKDAKDVYGKKFKPYRSKTYEQRKRGNKFKGQAEDYANSTAPVLTLLTPTGLFTKLVPFAFKNSTIMYISQY